MPRTAQNALPGEASLPAWARALGAELVGWVLAISLAVLSLRHVLSTDRARLLWYDGDSVLLALVARGIRLGEPFEWAMSPTLFFFPEIPVYLFCAAVTATTQQALALNGVLVLLAVYALVRFIAGELMPAASRLRRVMVSVGAMAALTLLILTETSESVANLELASLLLLTTYYYGAVLATLATAGLAIRAVRQASAPVPRIGAGTLAVLGLVAAATTMSDPLYVPWAAGPVIVTVAGLALLRRVPRLAAVALTVTLAIGSAVGWIARIPVDRYVSIEPANYIKLSNAGDTLQFFATITDTMAGSGLGGTELFLLLVGFLVGVGGTVWAWRRRNARTVLVACALSVVTTIVLSIGVVVSGSETPRYLQPIAVLPLVSFVAVAELFRTRVHPTRVRRRAHWSRLVTAIAAVGVFAAGVAAAPGTAHTVASERDRGVQCLEHWVGTREVEGVGQYWTVRSLMAYGSSDVRLLQVRNNLHAYPWLVNLSDYAHAHPSYVVVGSGDVWPTAVEDQLGQPASIVACSGYDIFDYGGTHGALKLQRIVAASADKVRAERGFSD